MFVCFCFYVLFAFLGGFSFFLKKHAYVWRVFGVVGITMFQQEFKRILAYESGILSWRPREVTENHPNKTSLAPFRGLTQAFPENDLSIANWEVFPKKD